MRREFALRYLKLGPAVVVVALAVLAGLPARAAERASAGDGAVRAGDPFASCNTELNAAASQSLDRVRLKTAAEAWRLPKRPDVETAGPESSSLSGRLRVDRLLPVIAPILKNAGVPVALAAVVLVESGGDARAISPKGARGLWQLMPDTAREYGLIVNERTDQRLDVVRSTRAAAEYLRDLHVEFHNWKLALAAYNAGDMAVRRAMARTGGDAFSSAASALPEETQSYVPKVMRALDWFGGPVPAVAEDHAQVREVIYAEGDLGMSKQVGTSGP